MNELIKIKTNEDDITLSGRELHEFLEIKTEYAKWISRMIEYGFTENQDFRVIVKNDENPKGGRPGSDHEIKLDMAKEIAMIQRNEKGKQARKYFLEVEKAWNSPEMIMKRALEIANKRVENLQLENTQQKQIIGELKPKADYTDIILKNKGLVTITQIAKDYGLSGQALNDKLHELKIQYKIGEQWLLYSKYHAKGYTHSETIPITRKNGMKDVNMITKWTQKGRLFIYELLKKNNILPLIESEEF
ncbi:phage antirepressor KilAC domain-containing protein [Clostridium tertium]|jgi:anti-repressor protein|uniref:phage antirepressor KilAC domain-containing protein n=2 Tax=Clostridium tertium TaxID=1559 RepID=UPI000DD0B0D9|nr:phage antirepressor KilAC domain-containing protein [Clostridium tertium]MBU6137385.1 phage antirepressor KilAC domain-containing protein [Clostridium tertium]MDB1939183.1 phage antirepressor KilAC domain-containing protein [Clostridium tertium]MDB1956352.1 phage antirepressor KilAC domain-containing protein [Clostridium tertium]MDB1959648.1 phage antirepressor KilAC domain-containing protein [Clostridium tertium]MDB1961556.1 phage antirepressor KilAC domain-containing protein [Clostridium 